MAHSGWQLSGSTIIALSAANFAYFWGKYSSKEHYLNISIKQIIVVVKQHMSNYALLKPLSGNLRLSQMMVRLS